MPTYALCLWGQLHLGVFAIAENVRLPTSVSPLLDPEAWKVDALIFSLNSPVDVPVSPRSHYYRGSSSTHPDNPVPSQFESFSMSDTTVALCPAISAGRSFSTAKRSAQATSVTDLLPGPIASVSTCMEALRSALVQRGFSSMMTGRITSSQRNFTQSVCDSKWMIFTEWCQESGRDLLLCHYTRSNRLSDSSLRCQELWSCNYCKPPYHCISPTPWRKFFFHPPYRRISDRL